MKHQKIYFDAVRGISAQMVVVGHAATLAFVALTVDLGDGQRGAEPGRFHIQSYGVIIFLVLSGYLITSSVARSVRANSFSFGKYFADRAARIFTPLIPAVLLVWVVDRLVFGGSTSPFVVLHHDAKAVVSNLLLLQDNAFLKVVDHLVGTNVAARSLGSAAPWWTVALEWWIYMAFGLIVLLALRPSRLTRMVAIPFLLFAAATVAGSLALGNGLVLAWLVGFLYAWNEPRMQRLPVLALRIVAVLGAVSLVGLFVVVGASVYSPVPVVLTAVVVLAGYRALPWERGLTPARRVVTFWSDCSYSVYLIHFSTMIWLAHALASHLNEWALFAVMVAAGNACGIGWWWLFERRYETVRRRLRARFQTAPTERAPVSDPAVSPTV